MGGEEQFLIWIEAHGLGDDTELHGLQVFRALRDDHDIRPVFALHRFPQSSCRQEGVVDNQAMVVDEQNVNARLHITVLEGIIEQNDIDILYILSAGQPLDAPCPFLVYGYGDVRELGLHLVWLIADGAGRCFLASQHESAGLALIASAQHGYLGFVFQQPDQILHMRCFTSTSDGDISDRDDRCAIRTALQNTHLEEQVPETDA